MPRLGNNAYTVAFATAICIVCALLVSGAAVGLADRQAVNAEVDRQRNVLMATGDMRADESLSPAEIADRFAAFQPVAVDLATGRPDPSFTVAGYDPRRALADPSMSHAVPANPAQVTRVPNHVIAYERLDETGERDLLVLPIEGKGLWSTMYGFLALGPDLKTVRGLTFYQHGETPGLGGEISNPRWQAAWNGRQLFDEDGDVAIAVIRGRAGPADEEPHRVDGLSGATITGRGVEATVKFWLGEQGFGPYLESLRKEGSDVGEGA